MHDEKIDVKENTILNFDYETLCILLRDNTSNKNILWATDNYSNKGEGYQYNDEITINKITGRSGLVIRPRVKKSKQEQLKRSREKAEVFTPSWICNVQNNMIDNEWFGEKNIFNIEKDEQWITNKNKIQFSNKKNWMDYVKSIRLEITCGEAPYLVSRYDTVSGDILNVNDRIGLLDRKIRIINENCDDSNWYLWVIQAYKSIYGYEWQGDSVLIARENLLYSFIDYYQSRFGIMPEREKILEIVNIISWNIWQMDGIKFVIPNSCCNKDVIDYTLFGEIVNKVECEGCKKNKKLLHNGVYCKIMNWNTNRKMKFVSTLKK